MKKIYLVVLGMALLSTVGFAQKGKNQLGAGLDLSFPTGDFADGFKTGLGLYVKGLYGIGESGQVTLTIDHSCFKAKVATDNYKIIFSTLPILAGYRHHYGKAFVEPQIGYGNYSLKIRLKDDTVAGDESTDSGGAFTWALGAGYIFNQKLEAGFRYQNANKDDSGIGMFALRVGYNFSLAKK